MNRRQMLAFSALALTLPGTNSFAGQAGVPYSRDAYDQALASGTPLLLAFNTTW